MWVAQTGMSILRILLFAGVVLLVGGFASNAEALVSALEKTLPSVQGWKIEALKRGSSVMCLARQKEKNGKSMTLLADTGKYRGGVWFLDVSSRNHHLEPDVQEIVAHLSLNGKHVVTGTALAIVGEFVRFEFPAIDAYVKDIKTAHVVEVQAQGLSPLKIESLPPIITALEKCQQESLSTEFWKDAKHVCN
jgi:hypothetical protein